MDGIADQMINDEKRRQEITDKEDNVEDVDDGYHEDIIAEFSHCHKIICAVRAQMCVRFVQKILRNIRIL